VTFMSRVVNARALQLVPVEPAPQANPHAPGGSMPLPPGHPRATGR
jgi:hypothetical protein